MLTRKVSFIIYIITILFTGLLFGGFPNLLMPFQQILIAIGIRSDILAIFPVILIFLTLLLITFFLGRILCAYACPLGALQELISKINFKSDLKAQKKAKFHFEVSSSKASLIRRAFLGITILFAAIWSIQILLFFNPILGFWYFIPLISYTFIIPFIGLIVVSIASIFLYRPFCRFICPFGAFASLCSRFSRNKYQRTEECNECGLCEKICPTQEARTDSKNGECYYCNRCIDICPKDAIEFSMD